MREHTFKRAESLLIVTVDKWSHILGYPGGMTDCGYCNCTTQWGWCPQCQPEQFASLP